jgi:hypothetical protein
VEHPLGIGGMGVNRHRPSLALDELFAIKFMPHHRARQR